MLRRNCCGELAEQDFELVALDYDGWIEKYPPINPRCRVIPFETKTKFDFSALWQLRGLVTEHRPDILHASLPKPLAVAVVATTGLKHRPRIVSFRGISNVPNRWDPTSYLTYLNPIFSCVRIKRRSASPGTRWRFGRSLPGWFTTA